MAMVKAAERACLTGRSERAQVEFRVRHRSGAWLWLRSDAVAVGRDAAGSATRVIGTQTDITDLKSAEAALRDSEARFRSALEDAPVGMALLDLDGCWLKVNAALCGYLGYSEAELLARDFQSVTHPDDLQADLDLVRKLVAGELKSYQLEKRYLHKDGHAVWGLLSVSLARNSADGSAYFISQIQDITDRKEMERLKSEFVATVSHELRTPLTSIRGSLGLVMGAMGEGIPERPARLLSIAHKNCERLILLINDILDLEKISSGSMRFKLSRERIASLVRQATEANQGFAGQYGVALAFADAAPACEAEVDAARLQQVLTNLLSNAAKFSPKGGVVRVAVSESAGRVRVSVSDQGPGVPPEFRARIFGRFSQADASATRGKGGTGLGLHISQQIVQRMGGGIGFESEPGRGATFWIELPCVNAPSALAAPARGAAGAVPARPRALHVENDADFSEFLGIGLRDRLQIVNAPTFAEARAALTGQRFDLVILDPELPDGSGLDLLGENLGQNARTPVVLLSASEVYDESFAVGGRIVKSRVPDHKILDDILGLLTAARGGRAA
jgi:PAS domain S-box-containing protein